MAFYSGKTITHTWENGKFLFNKKIFKSIDALGNLSEDHFISMDYRHEISAIFETGLKWEIE